MVAVLPNGGREINWLVLRDDVKVHTHTQLRRARVIMCVCVGGGLTCFNFSSENSALKRGARSAHRRWLVYLDGVAALLVTGEGLEVLVLGVVEACDAENALSAPRPAVRDLVRGVVQEDRTTVLHWENRDGAIIGPLRQLWYNVEQSILVL